MAMANSGAQPRPISTGSTMASAEEIQEMFEVGVCLRLCLWPDLAVAVTNLWGGPDSADKRDWLAGHISDLVAEHPDTDAEDIEIRLLEFLEDEFNARLETESEVEVARDILLLRKDTSEGNFQRVQDLRAQYERKGDSIDQSSGVEIVEYDQEEDDGDEEWDVEDEDHEMSDAPALVAGKEANPKSEPEIDQDGFTKVIRRKAR